MDRRPILQHGEYRLDLGREDHTSRVLVVIEGAHSESVACQRESDPLEITDGERERAIESREEGEVVFMKGGQRKQRSSGRDVRALNRGRWRAVDAAVAD